jgi:hypothetical protein
VQGQDLLCPSTAEGSCSFCKSECKIHGHDNGCSSDIGDADCVKGPENAAADALSHLPASVNPEKLHVLPSREESAECFAEDDEPPWSFLVSITLIKSFQQERANDLTQKAASDDPARDISPFRGGAAICHNDKAATPLQ